MLKKYFLFVVECVFFLVLLIFCEVLLVYLGMFEREEDFLKE